MTGEPEKQALRAAMKARRGAMPAEARAAAAERVAAIGIEFTGVAPGSIVSAFLSIGDELATDPILTQLHARGYRLALPVMQGKREPLIFRSYVPGDVLDSVVWGIREPKPEKAAVVPAVLLVPLLAFDAAGWRLGYGGGYYDRTLRHLRSLGPVTAVGLAFDEQEVDAVPHLDYDEPLDWVLTPSGPRPCRS